MRQVRGRKSDTHLVLRHTGHGNGCGQVNVGVYLGDGVVKAARDGCLVHSAACSGALGGGIRVGIAGHAAFLDEQQARGHNRNGEEHTD